MAVTVACPKCEREYTVPDTFVGQTMRCKECGQSFRTVDDDAEPPPARRAKILFLVLGGVGLFLFAVAGVLIGVNYLTRKPETKPAAPVATADPTPKTEAPKADPPKADPPKAEPAYSWVEVRGDGGRFTARFPARPDRTEVPGPDGPSVNFTLTQPDGRVWMLIESPLPGGAGLDPKLFIDSMVQAAGPSLKEQKEVRVGDYRGVDLRLEQAGQGIQLVTMQRVVAAGGRMYQLVVTAPAALADAATTARFFDSFKITAKAPPAPADPMPPADPPPKKVARPDPPPPSPDPPVRKPDTRTPLERIDVRLPTDWTSRFDKETKAWIYEKETPGMRTEFNRLRLSELPADPGPMDAYAAKLKDKDFVESGFVFTEVTQKRKLADGFLITGVVANHADPSEKPRLGLVMVRKVGDLWLTLTSTSLRKDGLRQEAVELFQSVKAR